MVFSNTSMITIIIAMSIMGLWQNDDGGNDCQVLLPPNVRGGNNHRGNPSLPPFCSAVNRSLVHLFVSVLILFSVNLSLVYIFFQPLKIRNFLLQLISSGKNVEVKEVLGPTPSTIVLHGLDDQDDGRPDAEFAWHTFLHIKVNLDCMENC